MTSRRVPLILPERVSDLSHFALNIDGNYDCFCACGKPCVRTAAGLAGVIARGVYSACNTCMKRHDKKRMADRRKRVAQESKELTRPQIDPRVKTDDRPRRKVTICRLCYNITDRRPMVGLCKCDFAFAPEVIGRMQ